LIQALPRIIKHHPKTLAIFVGPDYSFGSDLKSYTKVLVEKATRLKIRDHTIFKGFVPENLLRSYYNAADVSVCSSNWPEPFGKVIIEAMAYEKPVIASKVGGVPEIIQGGINGLLVPPNSFEALADAIIYLLDNPRIGEAIGRKARECVEENYSFPRVSGRCLQIYSDVQSSSAEP
jgi:glycosyltransferase involved in cell wall biosynthesis